MENFVYFDFETRSCADLFKVGGYEYAMDPSTEVTALGYAIGDERPKVWRPLEGDPIPKDFIGCIEKGYYFVAHNAQFERIIWKHVLEKQGFPPLDESKILCTMVQAYTHGLQGSLEKCAKNLKLPQEKDMSGSRVMLQLAKPRTVVDGVVTWWEKEDSTKNLDIRAKYKTLYAYCAQDVIVTRNIFKSLIPLVKSEREMYALDQRINDFGVPVDREACKKLIKVADHEAERINERLKIITGGKIKTVNQHTLLRLYINAQGVETESLDKAHVEMLLEDDIPDHVREILELKKAASKSSVKKLTKMLSMSEKDGRARGTLQFYGAASTGRFSGRGIQFQNLPRPTLNQNNIESILAHVEENNHIPSIAEHIDVMYDNPMFAIASCIRGCVRAEDGKKFVAADFSAIEARVLAWLAGQEDVLDVFRTHGKIYEKEASGIYHIPIDEVTKDQRQIGKVACIAEGELVLTDKGLVPIEKVQPSHKVWDGVEWVSHDGVVFKGEKEVIYYEGLWATKDHRVFTKQERTIPFGQCAIEQTKVLQTGLGRKAIRVGGNNFAGHKVGKLLCKATSSVRDLRSGEVDKYAQSFERQDERVPEVQPAAQGAEVAVEKNYGDEMPVSKRVRPTVQKLRCARNNFRVRERAGLRIVDTRELRFEERFIYRPDRQRQRLCTRKPQIRRQENTSGEQERLQGCTRRHIVGGNRESLLGTYNKEETSRGFVSNGHRRTSETCGAREKKELASNGVATKRARVYDIVNAGPRHRFTVSDKLVHNCLALGYGGGVGAFQSMAKNYGVKISDSKADDIKVKWRKANSEIVDYWYALENAAIKAVQNKGSKVVAGPAGREVCFKVVGNFLFCRLPSGRFITTPYPHLKYVPTPWGSERLALFYYGEKEQKFIKMSTYGGKLAENITQAVSADLLRNSLVQCELADFPVTFHVHDEIVCELDENDSRTEKELEKCMEILPPWAKDLPIKAEGWQGKRFRK